MKRSPLVSAIIYLLVGGMFIYFAIDDVQTNGWSFFSYLLVILATFDIGSGVKMIGLHFKYKNQLKK